MPIKLSKLEGDRLPSDGLLPGIMGCKQIDSKGLHIYIAYEKLLLVTETQ